MSYTVAETGTCFLAACLPTFRPLLRAISNTFSSSFSKMYTARRRASSDSALVEHAAQAEKGDTESPKKSAQKEVKGFTSVLLSNISVERPTISDQVWLFGVWIISDSVCDYIICQAGVMSNNFNLTPALFWALSNVPSVTELYPSMRSLTSEAGLLSWWLLFHYFFFHPSCFERFLW